MWDMTHSHVWHDSFTCETWLLRLRTHEFVTVDVYPSWVMMHECHDFICQCAITHSSVLHNLFIFAVTSYPWVRAFLMSAITRSFVPWRIHVCCDSFLCAVTHSCMPWLIHVYSHSFMCATIHSDVPWLVHVCHDSFMCAWTHSRVTWHIHECHDSFMRAMTHSDRTSWYSDVCDTSHRDVYPNKRKGLYPLASSL